MGLGNSENDVAVDDGDGGGGGGVGGGGCGKSFGSVSCSICLDVVTDNGDRSWAKLQCGHQFHLDCIGSAFNIKGAMQCPNCRKIEKGQWLYANGCRSLPEFSMDDWTHDEDLYDLGAYSEMSFGVHWCPYASLPRLPSSFEDGEFSSNAYHDLLGQHAIFAEHTAPASSATHPCPYIAYIGPIHPSSSNSSGSVPDGSNYNNHWNGPSAPGEIPSSYGFPAMYWEHQSHPLSTSSTRIGGADQPSIPPVTQRPARNSSDHPRSGSFVHQFVNGHSVNARAGSSVSSSMNPAYQGSNARARDRVQALQAYYQQQPGNSPAIRTPVISGRSGSHRGLSQVGPVASTSDQTGFYFVPPGASIRSFQEAESPVPVRFRGWERDHVSSYPSSQVERESSWSFHQTASGSDPGIRSSSYRQRHRNERMSSQNR
ncbi:E3 ubiquitin-protein ligase RFI2 [Mercurialis annua]|uniref:E3 ubiquitin-protein ligase RFI2 n=1 Tax=Mercurialis annua TaxID=3986 RepID=UPI00215F65B4|nr:E3 ubiquitin-protein ligase RFI2 [Mercurialis annua]